MDVILLDLDMTLVHTTFDACVPGYDLIPHPDMFIHVRPHTREFLTSLASYDKVAEVGFWTCGTPEYAQHVVRGLLDYASVQEWPSKILMTREDATSFNGIYVKDLELVKQRYNLNNVVLVDDNTVHMTIPRNIPHIHIIEPFDVTKPDTANDSILICLAQRLLWRLFVTSFRLT